MPYSDNNLFYFTVCQNRVRLTINTLMLSLKRQYWDTFSLFQRSCLVNNKKRDLISATFTLENEYDFANLVLLLSIITFHTNLLAIVFFSIIMSATGTSEALATNLNWNSKVILVLELHSSRRCSVLSFPGNVQKNVV